MPWVLVAAVLAVAAVVGVLSLSDGEASVPDDELPPDVDPGTVDEVIWRSSITAQIRGRNFRSFRLGFPLWRFAALRPRIRELWSQARTQLEGRDLLPSDAVVAVLQEQRRQARDQRKWWRQVAQYAIPIAAALLYLVPGVGPVLGPLATAAAPVVVQALQEEWSGLELSRALVDEASTWVQEHPDWALLLAGADAAEDAPGEVDPNDVDDELVA